MSLGMYLYKRKIKKILEKYNLKEEELGAKHCFNCKHYRTAFAYVIHNYCNISYNQPGNTKVCDMFQFSNSYLKYKIKKKQNKYNFRDVEK